MPCRAGVLSAVVHANGDVGVCEQRPPLGNLRQQSFMEIWRSHQADRFASRSATRSATARTRSSCGRASSSSRPSSPSRWSAPRSGSVCSRSRRRAGRLPESAACPASAIAGARLRALRPDRALSATCGVLVTAPKAGFGQFAARSHVKVRARSNADLAKARVPLRDTEKSQQAVRDGRPGCRVRRTIRRRHDLGQAAAPARQDRNAAGHRFHGRQPKALPERWQDERGRAAEKLDEIGVGEVAGEMDMPIQGGWCARTPGVRERRPKSPCRTCLRRWRDGPGASGHDRTIALNRPSTFLWAFMPPT